MPVKSVNSGSARIYPLFAQAEKTLFLKVWTTRDPFLFFGVNPGAGSLGVPGINSMLARTVPGIQTGEDTYPDRDLVGDDESRQWG